MSARLHAVPPALGAALGPVLGLLGLSGYEADTERLARAVAHLAAAGVTVRQLPPPGAHFQRFAASDAERVAALRALADDPAIRSIMAVRGGYGASRLLPAIDFAALGALVRAGRKRFIGHSDFTAFHLGLLTQGGATSFAGPMAAYDFGGHGEDQGLSAFTIAHLQAVLEGPDHRVEFAADGPDLDVAGTLWGGNLSLVCSLVGTPWLPDIAGGVLFVEDIGEQPYRIERMLLHLHHAGVLARQAAILVGDFALQQPTAYDIGFDVAAVVAQLRAVCATPIITGLPFGHIPDKLTLPVGGRAALRMRAGLCRLTLSDYA